MRLVVADALRAALEQVTVQGSNTLYQFSPTDHSGQEHVPNPLAIAQFSSEGDRSPPSATS